MQNARGDLHIPDRGSRIACHAFHISHPASRITLAEAPMRLGNDSRLAVLRDVIEHIPLLHEVSVSGATMLAALSR